MQESEEVRYQRQGEQEKQRRLINQLRDLREDYLSLQGKEADVTEKRNVLEKVSWETTVLYFTKHKHLLANAGNLDVRKKAGSSHN